MISAIFFFSCTVLASLISARPWKVLCIPWGFGCLLCDRVITPMGEYSGQWGSMPMKSQCCPTNQMLLLKVAQVPLLRLAGIGGVRWVRRGWLMSLWLCCPPSNGDYQTSAASSLRLHVYHWSLLLIGLNLPTISCFKA